MAEPDTTFTRVTTTAGRTETTTASETLKARSQDEALAHFVSEKMETLCAELTSDVTLDNLFREHHLSLTASENYPSKLTRMVSSAMQGAFYEFRPPYEADAGEWFFPDSGAKGSLVARVASLGKKLFHTQTFDWRPNGGSVAEQAVLLGTCRRGDAFVHFARKNGGHFALEKIAREVGIGIYEIPIVERTQLIDVDQLLQLVRDHPEIKLIELDQSFKLRWQPIDSLRKALPVSIVLSYDASHDGGLIVGDVLPQPALQGADIVHGNTHKTIPGPQKAFVGFRDKCHPALRPVADWVCPHLQSNCHAELLPSLLVTLTEVALFGKAYAEQICLNAKSLARALAAEGFHVAGEFFNFTETHQTHVILGEPREALYAVSDLLPRAGIRTNNIEVPGSNGQHGLRLGVQALTRRGMTQEQMCEVARFLSRALLRREEPEKLRNEVAYFLRDYPMYPLAYSTDAHLQHSFVRRLLEEVAGW